MDSVTAEIEEAHRQALIAAAGGNRKFFIGTDGASHARRAKESARGRARRR